VKELAQSKALLSQEDLAVLASFKALENQIVWQSRDPYAVNVVTPLIREPAMKVLAPEEVVRLAESDSSLFSEENVLLDAVLPLSLVAEIKDQVDSKYRSIADASSMEKLFWHDDFRYSLGMIYAQKLTKQMGIESDVQWVPSFPLGTNVVTLAELALAYQSILQGKTYRYFNSEQENQLLLIKRIEDEHGNLLWEAEEQTHQLVDSFYSAPMLSVLRGTVTNGTARAANRTVVLRSTKPDEDALLEKASLRIPSFGKTGTTNDYVNATYVGFLPYPEDAGTKELSPENAFTIAAYVGYDTNEPMRRRGFKVAGGTGALPAWIEIAQSLIREKRFSEKIEWRPLLEKKATEVPFRYGDDVQKITVPVHGASASNDDADGKDDTKADLNAVIDDYASSANPAVRLVLSGRNSDGVFSPTRRVLPFSVRVKEPTSKSGLPVAAQGGASGKEAPEENGKIPQSSLGNSGLPEPANGLAKNVAPAESAPQTPKENLTPEVSIPKFKIDDTFHSEDPVN
jgi:membrane peptidoglycan carboxypeptidase